jgi:oligosaccharide repeat unit polymerase
MPFYEIRSLVTFDLPIDAQIKTIFIFILFLTIYQHFVLTLNMNETIVLINTEPAFIKIGKYIMIIAFPFFTYRLLIEAMYIFQNGYISLYIGGLDRGNYNIIIRMSSYVFSVGYACLLCGIPKERDFKLYSGIYFFTVLLDTLKGSRGGFVVFILFYLWYNRNIYKKTLKTMVLIILATIVMFFSQIIVSLRGDSEFFLGGIFESILGFIYSQGQSIIVPALYICNKEALSENLYPYILSPILYLYDVIINPGILTLGQSLELIQMRYDLSHNLTYYLNSGYYLGGMSIGNNFLAELYEFGMPGIICGAVIVAVAIKIINKKVGSNRIWLYFSYPLVSHIIYMPRGSFFYNTYSLGRNFIAFLFIYIVANLISKKTPNK